MFQLIRQGKPYPTRDGTPDNSEVKELVKGKFEYDKIATTLPEIFENGDLYLNYMRGGPGLGDPLEREPQKVVEDVNEGFVSAKFAKSIYGVVIDCVNGTWVADSEKTKLLRKDAKTERGKKAVPVSEWWKKERQKVLDKSIPSLSLDMLKSSMKLSANWEKKFKDFWKLPKNFQL
jgi:hypothetical protein